jgi:diaminohydroxyphosphoribosylaminopyrimidine deaminase/5-amino-6-(5-phosphoribosylamino)uracil reductase
MTDAVGLWARVFELAARGRYSTSPNPRVGALLVDDEGSIVGEGFHERAGEAHAEVEALKAAGEAARGATLLVNLEPCASYGRTGPCTDALVAAGVRRVVCSIEDPDLRTAGRGIRRLLEGGVEVDVGACAVEAEHLNEAFLVSARERRPYVHLKWAASLDGRTATATGASKWITGEAAREDAMRLREEHDAILVGAGTILADDPRLTRRLGLNRSIVPHQRIVLDGALNLAPERRVFDASSGDVWLVTARPKRDPLLAPFRERRVRVESLPSGADGEVDLAALLRLLHAAEVRSLLVEGGGRTAWTFLKAGLADRVTAYVAPLLIGGRSAPGPLGGSGFPTLESARRLGEIVATPVGESVRLSARLLPRA